MSKKMKTHTDELLENLSINTQQDFNEFMKKLTKSFIEKSLSYELDEHMDYEKWDQPSRDKPTNYRKKTTSKKVNAQGGKIELNILRDYDGSFEPQLIKKTSAILMILKSEF